MTTNRAPIILKIASDSHDLYLNAWAITTVRDGELNTVSGNTYTNSTARLGAGLLHLRQLTTDCPTIRTVTKRGGDLVDIVLENIESIEFPPGASWGDVTMRGNQREIVLERDVAEDLLASWIANSQQGFPIPA